MERDHQHRSPTRAERLVMSYCYGGTVQYEPREVLGPRLLTDYEAVMIIDGFPIYAGNEGELQLEPGSILLARPGSVETYRWDARERTQHAYLHFDLESLPGDLPAPDHWPACKIHPPEVARQILRHLIERAVRHSDWPARKPGPSDNRIMEAFLDVYVRDDHEDDNLDAPRWLSEPVRRAVKFMREQLDTSTFTAYSLDALASAAHVTPKHLCRAFQQELGVSPMKACRYMQFQLAIPLLARSNLPVKSIAMQCGFPDQLHFSRSFRKVFGVSPSEARASMRRGHPPPPNPLPSELMPRLRW